MPKEENEIQSYINSFKEMEEPEEPGQSGSKVYIEETEITTSEAILEGKSYILAIQNIF